nr:hypothetical protein [Tanacetum cinerariifolium]
MLLEANTIPFNAHLMQPPEKPTRRLTRRGGRKNRLGEEMAIEEANVLFSMVFQNDVSKWMLMQWSNTRLDADKLLKQRFLVHVQSVAWEFSVDAMPTFLFLKNGEVEEFIAGDKIGRVGCDHGYHAECIDQWLSYSKHKSRNTIALETSVKPGMGAHGTDKVVCMGLDNYTHRRTVAIVDFDLKKFREMVDVYDFCQPKNHDYYNEQNSCHDSNFFGFDHCQPPQYTVNHHIFNAHNAFLDSQNELTITQNKIIEQMTQLISMCEMACQIIQKKQEEKRIEEEQAAKAQNSKIPVCCDDDDDYSAITPSEPVDSLSMGDEHLNTIPATESNKFIKSCVENLVPNPSESEGENGRDVHACFTTFSNFFFDADDESNSSDYQSCSDEDFSDEIYSNPLFEEEIISIKIDLHHFNAESDLVESLLNRDSSIISSSSKIDFLLDEFAGELTLLKSIPPGIDETDCYHEDEIRFTERLLYDNSSPRPPKEFVSENYNANTESFFPSPIPNEDSDSLMEEIDLSYTP